MPLDPRIALQSRTPDILSAVSGGLQLGRDIRMQPLREKLMKEQIAAQQAQAINRQFQEPADLRTFKAMIELANSPDQLVSNSAKVWLGQQARAGTLSTQERLAVDPRLASGVAGVEGGIAGAKEEAKLQEQRKIKPEIERGVSLAKDAASLSTEIFQKLGGIEENIRNMQEGIRLIDQGAATGPVSKFLPSFRESSVKLDNLKNRLGLDVISQVTFGALSEKELKTAFDTAVPSNLKGDSLRDWFQERINAQTKLASSLEGAGIFLSEEGATIPKLMAKRRKEREGGQAVRDTNIQSITTQEQYDALPSGAIFIEDGVQYRKP